MADATLLPSGAWRCRPTLTINGKKVTRSFTVHPDQCGGSSKKAKLKAEALAREWQLDHHSSKVNSPILADAMLNYINERSNSLSPVTERTYLRYMSQFDSIKDMHVLDIDSQVVQRLANDMGMRISKKTIKNYIGFLKSVLDYAGNNQKIKVAYKKEPKKKPQSPDHDDVYLLIQSANEIMKPIICLAAFGCMRRGEIAALKQKDISRDMCIVSIHADIVLNNDNEWVYNKMLKTDNSFRSIKLTRDIIDLLPCSDDPEAFLFGLNPGEMSDRFCRYRDKLGLHHVRLHDLRHYGASMRSDIGVPKKYIEFDGGWNPDSKILADVYDNPLESGRKKYSAMVCKYIDENFADVISKRA